MTALPPKLQRIRAVVSRNTEAAAPNYSEDQHAEEMTGDLDEALDGALDQVLDAELTAPAAEVEPEPEATR